MTAPVDMPSGSRVRILRWLGALAALGLLVRLGLFLTTQPASFGDTPTYWRLAGVLMDQGLSAYDATRVPGYPLFVAILGRTERVVWGGQLALGWLTSLLFFYLALRVTGDPRPAFVVGAVHTLSPGQVLFESSLLSEALTTFLVVGSLALTLALIDQPPEWRRLGLALAAGFVASLAGLVRTLFFLLPVLIFLLVLSLPATWWKRIRLGAAAAIGPILLLGGWIGFVYDHYGMLSPTTMGGYHLVQHTGAFFEYLPDGEAVLRDTYLRYRDAQIAERGVQTNAIWDAIPELSERTGLSFFALSSKLQRLSLQLIWEHPGLYLKSVVAGWIAFWKAPVYWRPELFPPVLAQALSLARWPSRALFVAANGAFLLLTLLTALWRPLRARLRPTRFLLLAAGLILSSSVVQTLVDHGDNPRFLVPLQMVVVLLVVWAAWRLWGGPRAIDVGRA